LFIPRISSAAELILCYRMAIADVVRTTAGTLQPGPVMAARRQTAPRNEIGNEMDTLERAETRRPAGKTTEEKAMSSSLSIYCDSRILSGRHFVFEIARLFSSISTRFSVFSLLYQRQAPPDLKSVAGLIHSFSPPFHLSGEVRPTLSHSCHFTGL